jgi:ABC-2 type transport system permease protein
MPLLIGFFMLFPTLQDPQSGLARAGSLIPFTSPLIMPTRVALLGPDWIELGISLALLVGTGLFIIWVGGKIYRIGILSTGKRPTPRELLAWLRTA